jgi:hypothetical protein
MLRARLRDLQESLAVGIEMDIMEGGPSLPHIWTFLTPTHDPSYPFDPTQTRAM